MSISQNVISANDLRSGLNVYFIKDGENSRWDLDISKATLLDESHVTEAFDLAKTDVEKNIVVDCLIVALDDNHHPTTTREKIRAKGPSTPYGHDAASPKNL